MPSKLPKWTLQIGAPPWPSALLTHQTCRQLTGPTWENNCVLTSWSWPKVGMPPLQTSLTMACLPCMAWACSPCVWAAGWYISPNNSTHLCEPLASAAGLACVQKVWNLIWLFCIHEIAWSNPSYEKLLWNRHIHEFELQKKDPPLASTLHMVGSLEWWLFCSKQQPQPPPWLTHHDIGKVYQANLGKTKQWE